MREKYLESRRENSRERYGGRRKLIQLDRKSFEITMESFGNRELIKILERGWED